MTGEAVTTEEEPLYTDENGVPMLFDVVIPGDYLKAAGFVLAPEPVPAAPAVEARLEAAIAAALPRITERAAELMREALLAEVQKALSPAADKPE